MDECEVVFVATAPQQYSSDKTMIKRGDTVKIKPEWADAGDAEIQFLVTADESKGRIPVMALLVLPINPVQIIECHMVEVLKSGTHDMK